MDVDPDRFDFGGSRTDLLAALDADIASNPSAALVPAKTFVRAQLAALPEQHMGCMIRMLANTEDNGGGWTIDLSFAIYPDWSALRKPLA